MALNVISNYAANVAHRNLTASDSAATSSLERSRSVLVMLLSAARRLIARPAPCAAELSALDEPLPRTR